VSSGGCIGSVSCARPARRGGKYLMEADPFTGKDLTLGRLRRRGIKVVGRLSDVDGTQSPGPLWEEHPL